MNGEIRALRRNFQEQARSKVARSLTQSSIPQSTKGKIMATVDWVLVADRSRARLLHALPGGKKPWPILASFIHVEGRQSPQELQSDAPGRIFLPGGARTAAEPHEDRVHVEARRFATHLAGILDRDRQERRFDRLFVIAAPTFLGVLREVWPVTLRRTVAGEVDLDLMNLEENELQARLMQIVDDLSAKTSLAST
uniref:Host attachment protein n=1 Tax=Schlesneria paludicola TaxID=360056 RepID=A0A7C4LJW9_9PLAN